MATVLPPLTALIDQGAAGGHEFERLMHQLLIEDGKRHGHAYEPVSGAGGDGGIDGWVAQGLPGFNGPVAFQFKWLWDNLRSSSFGSAKQRPHGLSGTSLSASPPRPQALPLPPPLLPDEVSKELGEAGPRQSQDVQHPRL